MGRIDMQLPEAAERSRRYRWEQAARWERAALRDGTPVAVRAAGAADEQEVAALFARASRESLRLRFCAAVEAGNPVLVRQMVTVDFANRAAVVVVPDDEPEGKSILGIGTYDRLPYKHVAELSFLVDDRWQGRGMGTLLLSRLVEIGRLYGLAALEADVMAENQPMLRLLLGSGLGTDWIREGSSVWVRLGL